MKDRSVTTANKFRARIVHIYLVRQRLLRLIPWPTGPQSLAPNLPAPAPSAAYPDKPLIERNNTRDGASRSARNSVRRRRAREDDFRPTAPTRKSTPRPAAYPSRGCPRRPPPVAIRIARRERPADARAEIPLGIAIHIFPEIGGLKAGAFRRFSSTPARRRSPGATPSVSPLSAAESGWSSTDSRRRW